MKYLFKIIRLLIKGEARAFAQGMALAFVVLVMGIALLALSGWFITAAAAAGLIGLGTLFNVFAPSAMVRFLALGRTAARYGERLTTHDATLRALSNLRIQLLNGVLLAPYRNLERLRASLFLNRVTADVDALDGLALRLVLPGVAGLTAIALTSATIALLVAPSVALVILLGYGLGPTLIFIVGQRLTERPARRAEAGMQALRSRVIDLIAVREELVAFGQVQDAKARVEYAAEFQSRGQASVEKIERRTGFWLEIMGWIVVSISLGTGASLAQAGDISAAQAAIGTFAALALSETVAPVRRALSEIGRMRSSARRVISLIDVNPSTAQAPASHHQTASLVVTDLKARRGSGGAVLFEPLSFAVEPGQTVALTGRSGCGKSTVLLLAAGQIAQDTGQISFGFPPSTAIAMVPQRHALVAGTIAENLRLAAPNASADELWAALEATQLARTLRTKNGLDTRLGFRGTGLSGGEARRLVLARAVLCKPSLLLLDEPTEGLDGPLAEAVLQGIRSALPDTAILMAAHRPEEVDFADVVVPLSPAGIKDANNSHL
ncbi:MAG: amino acid ABC transporter ATP-binding/permease protein [Thalassovita sp.]